MSISTYTLSSKRCGTCALWGGCRNISQGGIVKVEDKDQGICMGERHPIKVTSNRMCKGWKKMGK